MKKLLPFIFSSLLISSCTIFRTHEFGATPNKPGHYPPFVFKDYLTGQLDEYRAGYDVTFYNLDLDLEPRNKMIRGEVAIHFKALEKLKTIRIDLYENLHIHRLELSEKEIPFIRINKAVIASLHDSLVVGRDYILKVRYEGKPISAKNPPWSGGVIWKYDNDGNPWIGVTCETEGGSIWFPCKDHISDKPDSVRLRMSVPAGLQVVSNGLLENHISKPGKEVFTWATHYPVNIYNITFYAGKYEHFNDTMTTEQGILNLDYYVLKENLVKAKKHFEQVKDVISFYSRSFGPYPWIKEGFRLVEGPYEGMEHQTAIGYGSGYSNLYRLGGDHIIVHETAHEWWGNAVSVSDFSDIWLHEGFATYSEMIFAEHKKGYDNSLLYAGNFLSKWINNKLPVVGPPDVSYWDSKDNDVYNKGAMILHTIRNVLNDSTLFFNVLQTFYSRHAAASLVTTADFIEVLEQKTGKNWDKFFEAYLYSRKVPVLNWFSGSYYKDQDSGSKIKSGVPFVAVKWTNVPEGFRMPVEMYCKKTNVYVTIEVTTKPELVFIDELSSCNKIICNKRLSYFRSITTKSILKEIDTPIKIH